MGLNSPCWCESAKKYKLCHLNRDKLSKKRPIKAFSDQT
ncbi:SEC-C metal-binding domain-containing protein [Paraglaciecola hydrolytica]